MSIGGAKVGVKVGEDQVGCLMRRAGQTLLYRTLNQTVNQCTLPTYSCTYQATYRL